MHKALMLGQQDIGDPGGEEDDHTEDNEHGDDPPDELGYFLGPTMKKKTHKMMIGLIILYGNTFAKGRSGAFVLATSASRGAPCPSAFRYIRGVAHL